MLSRKAGELRNQLEDPDELVTLLGECEYRPAMFLLFQDTLQVCTVFWRHGTHRIICVLVFFAFAPGPWDPVAVKM